MKRSLLVLLAVVCLSTATLAAAATQYQVTGPVLEISDDIIVVQKENEKWAIARDKDTKVVGELKVGAKVTVYYTMRAAKIEVKEAVKKK